MTSFSGAVAYLEYVSRSNKGGVSVGDRFNGVFDLGNVNGAERVNFTSQAVVENRTAAAGATFEQAAAWYPIAKKYDANNSTFGAYDVKFLNASGEDITSDVTFAINADEKTISVTAGGADVAKIAYKYNQEYIPAHDIPTIGPVMRSIPLVAEPRRIAVKYDQITAYQAKQDYGFSLDKQIAEQACGELAYKKLVA